jgi:predicted dehydrogenase
MNDNICRWGILGTAGIAKKNWQSIYNAGNARLVAVASRNTDRAQAYVDECQAQVAFNPPPRAVGSYEELLASDDIDAIYLPLPTGPRKEWAIKVAEAGKHLMCEKPCGIDVAEVEEIIAACDRAGVQFMDGVMFMHSDRLPKLREVIEDGESLGRLRRIATQFSFSAPEEFLTENIRMHSDLEPLGCLGDLGWYNLRFTLWVMKYQMPRSVTGRLLNATGRSDSPRPVPTEFSGELLFDGDVSASFYCSFLTEHQQWAHLSGTQGSLRVDDFVLPYYGNELKFTVSNPVFDCDVCDFHMERHERQVVVEEYANSHKSSQETKLFRKFSDLALSGTPDSHWPEIALQTQRVMMACVESAENGGQEITLG